MAKMMVEVYSYDREPAHTWTITGPGGSPRQIDLCDQHSAPSGDQRRQPYGHHQRGVR